MNRYRTQTLIIGSGLAGCTAAIQLAEAGYEVILLTPTPEVENGNSSMAQGGIIFSTDPVDRVALERDIYIAGHKFNSGKAVHFLAQYGGEYVQEILINKLKVPFAQKGDTWDYTREGGHSTPRIIHCADYTGKAIMQEIMLKIHDMPNITLLTHHIAIDLITTEHHAQSPVYRYQLRNECFGAYVLNTKTNQVEIFLANHTVLATGGVGQVYLHSTNSQWAIGSGISMAQRAGVRLANMEHVQFHPTALFHHETTRFLISESMRGEGAILRNQEGKAFMPKYDERGDLAPRDIVAQAIVTEMLTTGADFVYLDPSSITVNVENRFPTIYAQCKKIGIDLHQNMIPVVPAAHYFCGGILVDQKGKSTLERLYAVGECSCTGVHGTNRLASTSLLEALLWGASAAQSIAAQLELKDNFSKRILDCIPDWQDTGNEQNDDPALIAQDWATIRNTMWNYVGIMRTQSRLRRAFADLRDLSSHLHDFYKHTPISQGLIRLFHGCQTAYIITQAALRNKSQN